MTTVETDPLRTCHRDGCDGRIPHPTRRQPGIRADYCRTRCVPEWLTQLPLSYAVRPRDVWARTGGHVLDVPAPVGPPLPAPTLPRHHQTCADCGEPVHVIAVVRGLCPDCIVDAVRKIIEVEEDA